MSVKPLLDNLSIVAKAEGSQWIISCPTCGKVAHCYVDDTTGLWKCHVCQKGGNPYQMVKHHRPDATPSEIMAMMEQFGLADGAVQKIERPKRDISWLREHLRKPSTDELTRLCRAKNVARQALLSFSPYMHKTDPVMYLPGCVPGQSKAVGMLRVHLDGELIETKQGPQKYPMIGNWGLLGLKAAARADTILFAEGWRDALAAIEAGYTAIANTGGTGWQAGWLPLFKGKVVIIVPDADKPGMDCAAKRADAISVVAKSVKIVELPYKVTEKHGKDLFDYLQSN